ncbi:hypothetical protein BJF92_23210 [Rhizobium rhizosphaerae]|uniref:Uncharacterized protein n=1 Tax=Xaviernesmea rhizosphaerae TaxID=1672749 RepID=A0A1Q9AJK3_9HYPH|nr:hypothetical protein [Xaviernesmea rhizosphaerae]OLP55452.1 hypothetical protein BJF92_23210 [Xaviernesmea rhizosphaerae]OQP85552.1 hypothetical protein BTR14_15310 [Xaviernesmea rhizosphaerae]
MTLKQTPTSAPAIMARDRIAFIRQMLGELRSVAEGAQADMLCYLIEMAYVEAGDILSGRRAVTSIAEREGDAAAGMAMEPPGKVKF